MLDIAISCPFFISQKCLKKIPAKIIKNYVPSDIYTKYKGNIFKKRFRLGCCFKQFGTVAYFEFVVCPTCETFINKYEGCDHMVCSRCLTHFCYNCGKKYHFAFDHSRLEFYHTC